MASRVLAAALLFTSSVACAAQWQVIGLDNQGAVSIDQASIVRNGAVVKYWGKIAYKRPQSLFFKPDVEYFSIVRQMYLNCTARMSATESVRFYDNDGHVVLSGNSDKAHLKYADIAPDSIENKEALYICPTPEATRQSPPATRHAIGRSGKKEPQR